MKRTSTHRLEDESRLALRNFLPSNWIARDKIPDYGIDMEIEIVEGENITNKVLWVQLKATEKNVDSETTLTYSIETKYLKHFEKARSPILVLYWVKPTNSFYYIFAQKYINDFLNKKKPNWRTQKTVTIEFSESAKLENPETLSSVATEGYFYVIQQQLIAKAGGTSTFYWLDGIPKSDDKELKERVLKALTFTLKEKLTDAINEYEDILRVCTISPIERMVILLRIGNAYYFKGQNNQASKNYSAVLRLVSKVNQVDAIFPKSGALGGLGLVFTHKGDLDVALEKFQEGFELIKDGKHEGEEVIFLNNIGLVYTAKGDLDKALDFFLKSLEMSRKIKHRMLEACILGNIGIVYMKKPDLDKSITYHERAYELHKELGNKREEALDLGNLGIIYQEKGDIKKALETFNELLEFHREGGYKQAEARDLGNIGLIYKDKGDFDSALKYSFEALTVYREIGYRTEEAVCLGNIGRLYLGKGDSDSALKFLTKALDLLNKYHLEVGKKSILTLIDRIKTSRGFRHTITY
jgi:tetratricopeptide (TPR) repeat protein